jgi:putative transposase
MSRKYDTPKQIVGLLREAEVRLSHGEKVNEICRRRV